MEEKNLIINKTSIQFKLRRLAYQILEDNYSEKEIELIGIEKNGEILSKLLKKEIENIQKISVNTHLLKIDKRNPLNSKISISTDLNTLKNKTIILVDDVINTGKTSFYSFKPLLEINAKSIKIAVLIDRRHKKYPIYSDYVGNKLSTTLQEFVTVEFDKNKPIGVYLS